MTRNTTNKAMHTHRSHNVCINIGVVLYVRIISIPFNNIKSFTHIAKLRKREKFSKQIKEPAANMSWKSIEKGNFAVFIFQVPHAQLQ